MVFLRLTLFIGQLFQFIKMQSDRGLVLLSMETVLSEAHRFFAIAFFGQHLVEIPVGLFQPSDSVVEKVSSFVPFGLLVSVELLPLFSRREVG